jgi:DNA replication initiation complex subunit (GINS family)
MQDLSIIIKIPTMERSMLIKKEKQVYGEFEKMIRDEICISLPSIDGINGTVSETYYRFKNLTRAEKEYTASMFWFNKLNGDAAV